MNKKFLSLVLALVMVLGTFGNVFAAAAPAKEEAKKLTSTEAKVQWLIDNKIVIGNADADGKADGNMALTDPIRRDHVAKMLVFALGEQDFAAKLQGVYRPFPDVELTSIVNGFISVAASKTSANGVPIIAGYKDGTFRPTREVTYAELAKMLVVAIDKDPTPEKVKGMRWHEDWMARAVQLGIFEGLSIDNPDAKAVRRDAFAMIYNAFFELKEVKAVPANETRGVISERSKGETITLNQGDYKVEYKVNDETIFVNQKGIAQKWLANRNEQNNYYVGSVVRVLADKDGVATHIIEMGNPVEGSKNRTTAWVDLGNKTLDIKQSVWNPAANNVKLGKDFVEFFGPTKKGYQNTGKFEVTNKTEFYVADYEAGILTKVKDYAAAKAVVGDKNNTTSNVYLAYETLPQSKVNEARVVVFNKADIEANSRLVRVAKPVSNPTYFLDVQGPGATATAVEQFDLRKVDNVWPYNYGLEMDDVFELVYNDNQYKGNQELVIDASEAPVYEVVKFLLVEGDKEKEVERAKANAVVLADKDGYQARFDLPTNRADFFTDKIVKGARVQIALRDGSDYVLRVVSVVQRDLKGILENGIDTKIVKGTVVGVEPIQGSSLARVKIHEEGQRAGAFNVYVTQIENFGELYNGKYVEVKTNYINKTYNVPEILDVPGFESAELVKPNAEAIKKAADSINENLQKAVDKDGKIVLSKDAYKAIVDARNKFLGLDEAVKKEVADFAGIINKHIDAYNNANDAENKALKEAGKPANGLNNINDGINEKTLVKEARPAK